MHSFTSSFEPLSDSHTSPSLSSLSNSPDSPSLSLPFPLSHFCHPPSSVISLTHLHSPGTPPPPRRCDADEPPSPPPGRHDLKPRPALTSLALTPLVLPLLSPAPRPEHRATTTSTPANHLSSPLSFPVTSSPSRGTRDLHTHHELWRSTDFPTR
ncbi:hypothetical protein D8674_031154 [Pyrus ussuriensis x Pyrus communis]|uniref:Uncharacterized protein n=1 Tax=Pyrus ussuriensis x Pyrus communis TaxID=2448454 RepID=A0A5N5FB07_9ROSA|nr:hypothetical protein D8674_031154 [Pyrus ussuriensis x Pyrus communis]